MGITNQSDDLTLSEVMAQSVEVDLGDHDMTASVELTEFAGADYAADDVVIDGESYGYEEIKKPVTQEDIDNAWKAFQKSPLETHCLLGPAGTGKTTMIRELTTRFKLVLTATTGVAAYNLGQNCTTINSFLGFYDFHSLKERVASTSWLSRKFEELRKFDGIVIDEISMMKANVLDLIVSALIKISEWRAAEGLMPLKLLLAGDFLQLPPIERNGEPLYAFYAGWWPKFFANPPHMVKLTTIYRQKDPAMQYALWLARNGNGVECMMQLRAQGLQRIDQPWYGFPGFSLYATNQSVEVHNRTRLGELDSPGFSVPSQRWGDVTSEELKEIPETVGLKLGCRVRFTANGADLCYVNGQLGTLMDYDPDKKLFIINADGRDSEPSYVIQPALHYRFSQRLPHGDDREIVRKTENMRYSEFYDYMMRYLIPNRILPFYHPSNDRIVTGVVEYFPVVLGYASTFHKSQGLTFDNVQIDIRNRFAGSPQMIYVALSRCRTVQGLLISGTWDQLARRIYTSPAVAQFI